MRRVIARGSGAWRAPHRPIWPLDLVIAARHRPRQLIDALCVESRIGVPCDPVGSAMATPKKKNPRLARCTGCGKARDVDLQRGLAAADAAWAECGRGSAGDLLAAALLEHRNWYWACNECLRGKRALAADPAKQTLGMGTPFAAYVDRPFHCEDCGAASCFTMREQQHWFETLGFLIWVYPKQCPPCRAKRRKRVRSQKALAEALAGLDPNDPSQLDAVARLYDEIGAAAKAATMRARAKNKTKARIR